MRIENQQAFQIMVLLVLLFNAAGCMNKDLTEKFNHSQMIKTVLPYKSQDSKKDYPVSSISLDELKIFAIPLFRIKINNVPFLKQILL